MGVSANIAELKASLSAYLKHIDHGEEVVITRRGKPIARIVPLAANGSTPEELADLIKSGQIRPPRQKLPEDFWDTPRVQDPEGIALKALLEERETGW